MKYYKHNYRKGGERYYRIGTIVYFHAYANKDHNKSFLCKGYIRRQPIRNSNVYKVVVLEVNTFCLTTGQNEEGAKNLLGKCIPRDSNQILSKKEAERNWLYESTNWEKLDKHKYLKINASMNRLLNKFYNLNT